MIYSIYTYIKGTCTCLPSTFTWVAGVCWNSVSYSIASSTNNAGSFALKPWAAFSWRQFTIDLLVTLRATRTFQVITGIQPRGPTSAIYKYKRHNVKLTYTICMQAMIV